MEVRDKILKWLMDNFKVQATDIPGHYEGEIYIDVLLDQITVRTRETNYII